MENGVSHNPQGLLWEELLKKNQLILHRRIWCCHFSPYSARVFLNKGLKALSTRHLFFDVLSIFRTPLSSFFVPDASGHWCLLRLVLSYSVWLAPTWRGHHGDHESDQDRHPPTGPFLWSSRIHPLWSDELEVCGVWRMISLFQMNWKGTDSSYPWIVLSKPSILFNKQTKQKTTLFFFSFAGISAGTAHRSQCGT